MNKIKNKHEIKSPRAWAKARCKNNMYFFNLSSLECMVTRIFYYMCTKGMSYRYDKMQSFALPDVMTSSCSKESMDLVKNQNVLFAKFFIS